MSTDNTPKGSSPSGTPLFCFLLVGETVCTVNLHMHWRGRALHFELSAVPVTHVGRSLPDWPRALSLRPDLSG